MANPFKHGHDPRRNLRGRGKGQINLADLVRKIAAEPVSPGEKMSRIEAIVRSTFKSAYTGDMRAVEVIMERGWGKAVQPIEGGNNGPLVVIMPEPPKDL